MDKNKRIRQAMLVAGIPGIAVFLMTAILFKLIETGVLSSMVAMILVLLFCGILVGVVAKFISGVMKSFSDVSGNIEKIASGENLVELNHEVKNEATRELLDHVKGLIVDFAKVIKGINDATNHLGELVTDFKDSFDEMSGMSGNIKNEAEKIAENAMEQAEMTNVFIENIESLGKAMDIIAEQIGDLSKSAENMKLCNDEADELMKDLVSISNQNGEAVESINKQTMATNHSVQEIMEAVDIITNIAGQTNLLALNASIEAARAGEQGRGFAVVAEEIGELAVQSRASSARIADIVNSLIQNSNESVAVTKQLEEAFGKQNEKIRETESIFRRLNCEIENVGSAITEIDANADDAKAHGDSMNGNVASLKNTVDKNTESIENTVLELKGFESLVDSCMEATESIAEVSDELVGYIRDINSKKK
ncbi:MAG: methyl-accepting chemotaxis protein [Agathobacter sp.]|nr:methyl-accepting chemotaxis protein [Agathobacter sp.]